MIHLDINRVQKPFLEILIFPHSRENENSEKAVLPLTERRAFLSSTVTMENTEQIYLQRKRVAEMLTFLLNKLLAVHKLEKD